MERKDWFVAVAIGLVPAIVSFVLADVLVVGVRNPGQPLAPLTVSRAVSGQSEPALAPNSATTPAYLPFPTYVPLPSATVPLRSATVVPANTPTIAPTTTITATTTVTPSVSPSPSPTATFQPSATSTATPSATGTSTYSPTPTPYPYDFMVLSRVEKCDPTLPANYSGDLVTGHVLDIDGRPLPGIRVRITSIHTDTPWTADTVTDEGGSFRFHLSKGNFETRVVSGSSGVANELWTRSASETGACRWQVTFGKTNSRTPVPQQ